MSGFDIKVVKQFEKSPLGRKFGNVFICGPLKRCAIKASKLIIDFDLKSHHIRVKCIHAFDPDICLF